MSNSSHNNKTQNRIPSVGSHVRIKGTRITGKVLSINSKRNTCQVDNGNMKLETSLDKIDILSTTKHSDTRKTSRRASSASNSGTTCLTIDLHGKTQAESQELLLSMLSDALIKGASQLEIIHGLGSGVIKQLTHDFLKHRAEIKNFKLKEGNPGTTIAYL